MGLQVADVRGDHNLLAGHYSRFRVAERVLLTGHSHQAWPDRGFDAQQQAWLDAAELVDDKWPVAFDRAHRIRQGFCDLLGDTTADNYALGASTHELLVRFLSALPLNDRPRILTTDGEFHSMRRQLDRLGEGWLEIVRVPVDPVHTLTERMAARVDARTAAVMMSAVMYRDGRIVPELHGVADAAARHGAEVLIDAYHALGVVPFTLIEQGLESCFVVGGGYKYCQLGEGNCFLRVPPDCPLRPVITGWFAEFDMLEERGRGMVRYPPGAARFQGSTYDPTSHYRGAAVFDFFVEQGLTPAVLRAVSQHQLERLVSGFDALGLDPAVIARPDEALSNLGGFLALTCAQADEVHAGLRRRNVTTDHRDGILRLGPAPYLSDSQLDIALAALGEVARGLS